ncbi:MAG: hypothetical protein WBH66_03640 [Rectinemataceae bacterium]
MTGKSLTESIKSIGVKQVLHYLDSDPDANIPKILAWVDRFDRHDQIKDKRTALHAVLEDHSSNWAADNWEPVANRLWNERN